MPTPDQIQPIIETQPAESVEPEGGKEQEPKAKVFLAYRRNALYDDELPGLAEDLLRQGYEVEMHPFEATGDRQKDSKIIKQWFLEHAGDLSGRIVITDQTANPSNFGGVLEALNEAGVKVPNDSHIQLDNIFDSASALIIMNADVDKLNAIDVLEFFDKEGAHKLFLLLMKQLLKNGSPEQIVIVSDKLCDHGPFETPRDEDGYYEDQSAPGKVATEIKEWITESGFPANLITIETKRNLGSFASKAREEQRGGTTPTIWYIGDRHSYRSEGNDYSDYEKMPAGFLLFPLSNFVQVVDKKKMIPIPTEAIRAKRTELSGKAIETVRGAYF